MTKAAYGIASVQDSKVLPVTLGAPWTNTAEMMQHNTEHVACSFMVQILPAS